MQFGVFAIALKSAMGGYVAEAGEQDGEAIRLNVRGNINIIGDGGQDKAQETEADDPRFAVVDHASKPAEGNSDESDGDDSVVDLAECSVSAKQHGSCGQAEEEHDENGSDDFAELSDEASEMEKDESWNGDEIVYRRADAMEEFALRDCQMKQIGIDPQANAIEMGEPCEREEHPVSFAADDGEADEDDGDGVECGAEEEEGFVVMKGAENFAGRELGFEDEHCPDGKRRNIYWLPWRSEARGC